MQSTTTVHWNRGGIAKQHNERDEELCKHEKHIDLYNEHGDSYHETLYRQDLREAYEEVFGDAIEEYNSKQKRKDRMKTVESYMDEVENDDRGKKQTKKVNGKSVVDENAQRQGKQVEYEITVKVGNTERARDDQNRVMYDSTNHHIRTEYLPRDLQREILTEYCNTFQEANPNFKVVSMELHGDEGFYNQRNEWEYDTIHPHITFFPVATGFTRGLTVQNSMNKALEQMGCGGANGYDLWAKKEQERLEVITYEKYRQYCLDHDDFYQEHGDLELYRPVQAKTRAGGKEKEVYAAEQEALERVAEREAEAKQICNDEIQRVLAVREEVETEKSTLETQKAEFEQNTASQRANLGAREYAVQKKEREANAKLEQAGKMYETANFTKRQAEQKLANAEELYKTAQELLQVAQTTPPNSSRESRMATYMNRQKMRDGKTNYEHFQEAEPKMIEDEQKVQLRLAELERKYGHIQSRSRNNDYDFDL